MAKGQKAATDYVASMKAKAEELAGVRLELGSREARFKEETAVLYEREAALKGELMENLKTLGLSSIKASTGESYAITRVPTFKFTNPIAEDAWARSHQCTTIDRKTLAVKLKLAFERKELPTEVEVGERETISIRKPKSPKPDGDLGVEESV